MDCRVEQRNRILKKQHAELTVAKELADAVKNAVMVARKLHQQSLYLDLGGKGKAAQLMISHAVKKLKRADFNHDNNISEEENQQ